MPTNKKEEKVPCTDVKVGGGGRRGSPETRAESGADTHTLLQGTHPLAPPTDEYKEKFKKLIEDDISRFRKAVQSDAGKAFLNLDEEELDNRIFAFGQELGVAPFSGIDPWIERNQDLCRFVVNHHLGKDTPQTLVAALRTKLADRSVSEVLGHKTVLLKGCRENSWLPPPVTVTEKGELLEIPYFLVAISGQHKACLHHRCNIGNMPYFVDDAVIAQLRKHPVAYSTDDGPLINVSGESGSGKTLGMISIAVHFFRAAAVLYYEVCSLDLKWMRNIDAKQQEARNTIVSAELCQTLVTKLTQNALLPADLEYDSESTIVVVLDEIGPYPVLLRVLGCVHNQVAAQLQNALKVKKIVMVCGGTGADVRGDPGTNPDTYELVLMKPVQPDASGKWLSREPRVANWLTTAPFTKLKQQVRDLLTNWRCSANLVGLLQETLCRHGIPLSDAPRKIEYCITRAMENYKDQNALSNITPRRRAIAVCKIALAFQMLSVQIDLTDNSPFLSLLTTCGLLLDNGHQKRDNLQQQTSKNYIGFQRYTMSPALQRMATMDLGLKGEVDFTGEAFEDEVCTFFFFLIESVITAAGALKMSVDLLLRKEWINTKRLGPKESFERVPHGFQLDYKGDNSQHFTDLHETPFDTLPVDRYDQELSSTLCRATRLTSPLEPPKSPRKKQKRSREDSDPEEKGGEDGDDEDEEQDDEKQDSESPDAKLEALKVFIHAAEGVAKRALDAALQPLFNHFPTIRVLVEDKSSISIWRNSPRSSFADIVIVNRCTKELWLVKCKSSVDIPHFSVSKELSMLGAEEHHSAGGTASFFRKALQLGVEAETVRYFFCISCPDSAAWSIRKKFLKASDDGSCLPRVTDEPARVHVLCNAFGFLFTPMNSANTHEHPVGADLSFEESALEYVRKIRDGIRD